jgi:hypothetical protein
MVQGGQVVIFGMCTTDIIKWQDVDALKLKFAHQALLTVSTETTLVVVCIFYVRQVQRDFRVTESLQALS